MLCCHKKIQYKGVTQPEPHKELMLATKKILWFLGAAAPVRKPRKNQNNDVSIGGKYSSTKRRYFFAFLQNENLSFQPNRKHCKDLL